MTEVAGRIAHQEKSVLPHLVHVIVHLEVGEADAHLEHPQRDGERDHGERELTEHDRRPSRLLKNGSPSHAGSGARGTPERRL